MLSLTTHENNQFIKNGLLLPDGTFYVCEFGGHSHLLKILKRKEIIDKNDLLVKFGRYNYGQKKHHSSYFNFDYQQSYFDVDYQQKALTKEQLDFIFKNIELMYDSTVQLILEYLKKEEPDTYSDFCYYLQFKN